MKRNNVIREKSFAFALNIEESTAAQSVNDFIILCTGYFSALQTDAVRRPIWITPNKRSAVRGTAYTSPQLRKELNSFFPSSPQGIELLRSSDGTWTVYPELRFACTGLSKLDAYGVKRRETSSIIKTIHEGNVK
ncbi:MAG: hypothetical protein LBK58_15235 [Prevotellaceae bacterium]|jgi:hypothetical protein|nr:hypothetical protein [Prevotellaceae bacterium]